VFPVPYRFVVDAVLDNLLSDIRIARELEWRQSGFRSETRSLVMSMVSDMEHRRQIVECERRFSLERTAVL